MDKKLKFRDDRLTLLCAFRYALGRRTYIVSDVVEDILNNWDLLEDFDKELIKKEILEHERIFENLGHECDKREWYKIINKE